jgi:hypothetical protein
MMIVISRKSDYALEACNRIAEERYLAPNAWAHRRAMLYMNKLNALDLAEAQPFLRTGPKNMRWIASWPLGVASALVNVHPDLFNDVTGKTMVSFLSTEAGLPFKVKDAKF